LTQEKKRKRKENEAGKEKEERISRGQKKQGAVMASMKRSIQEAQGAADAAREKQQELTPLEKFQSLIPKMRHRFERALAWVVSTYAWEGGYHSHSPMVHGLMQAWREKGLLCDISDTARLTIGGCTCDTHTPLEYAPNSWIQEKAVWAPFFDSVIPKPRKRHALFYDAEGCVYCEPTHPGATKFIDMGRFAMCEVSPALQRLIMAKWDLGEQEDDELFSDTLLRPFITPSRTFSEVAFGTSVQNLKTAEDRPSYARDLPYLLNQALLCIYSENAEMYRVRGVYGDRRHQFDEKMLEVASGYSFMGKSWSWDWLREWWEEKVKPTIKKKFDQARAGQANSDSEDGGS